MAVGLVILTISHCYNNSSLTISAKTAFGMNRYRMLNFKLFLVEKASEEEKNVRDIITSLPTGHQQLLKGFKFNFEAGNTLHNDKDHVGYVHKNKIVVAAPWKYSRGHTFLHEVAHLVYEKKLTPELKKEWASLVKKTKNKQDQNAEELFAHAYACHYLKDHCPAIHDNPEWHNFFKNRVPQ